MLLQEAHLLPAESPFTYPRKQVTHYVTHQNYLMTHASFQLQRGLATNNVVSLNLHSSYRTQKL